MNKIVELSFKKNVYNVVELLAILIIGFGIFIYSSTISLLNNLNATIDQDFNSFDFYFVVFYEVIILAIIISILKKRKWRLQDFNLEFKINMIFIGLILIVLRYTVSFFLNQVLINSNLLHSELILEPEITLDVSVFSIILMLIVNSVFEEVILIGYLFKKLEKFHVAIAIIFSLIIRVSFHTYQGLGEISRIIALGLVLGLYYSKYKKLWPVILAHGIGNLIVFLNIEYNWFDL